MSSQLTLFEAGSGAEFSSCGVYRYRLWRRWGPGPSLAWVMLNPSTADAEQNDPTIRRCLRFSRDWGFGGLEVVNLYAYRATDSRELILADNPVCHNPLGRGNDNDRAIEQAAGRCAEAIAAWGALLRGMYGDLRARGVLSILARAGAKVSCLGTTKSGDPRHPLYLRADTPIVEHGVV